MFHRNGIREINFLLDEFSIIELRKRWKDYLNNLKDFPEKEFSGKGIVICGGGVKYYTCAWICIKYLKYRGCTLPIELWYINNEIDEGCIAEMKNMGVVCKNLADYYIQHLNVQGYMMKPICILHSSFEEVLFLDADNICLHNPEYLFESKEYIETGAIFWPDYWKTAIDNPIWNIMEVKYFDMPEQESGQLLINKRKCWKAVNLCIYLNLNHKIYYKLLLGHKDTFKFAWLALKKNFYMVNKQPDTCGYIDDKGHFFGFTMVQYNLKDSQPLFLHRNLIKWSETGIDKYLWQKFKRFVDSKYEKEILIGYSYQNKHTFIDFTKGYEILDFKNIFGDIEIELMQRLKRLYNKKFYKSFLQQ